MNNCAARSAEIYLDAERGDDMLSGGFGNDALNGGANSDSCNALFGILRVTARSLITFLEC